MLLINFFILCIDIFAANACSDGDGSKRCTSYSSHQLVHSVGLEVSSSITPSICRIIFHFPSPARCPLTTIVGVGVVINTLGQAGSGL